MNNLIKKIKDIKHIEIYIAIVFIILAIIVYYSISAKGSKSQDDIEKALSQINGVGYCQVVVRYDESNDYKMPVGAIVVCDGANDIKVVEDVTMALKTLLGIDSKNIKVYKTK